MMVVFFECNFLTVPGFAPTPHPPGLMGGLVQLSIYPRPPADPHELQVVTERMRSRTQAAELSFLRDIRHPPGARSGTTSQWGGVGRMFLVNSPGRCLGKVLLGGDHLDEL